MATNYSDPGVVSYRARPGRYITMSAEKVSQNLQYDMNPEQRNRSVGGRESKLLRKSW